MDDIKKLQQDVEKLKEMVVRSDIQQHVMAMASTTGHVIFGDAKKQMMESLHSRTWGEDPPQGLYDDA